jgi:hypothetical protein
MSVGAACVVRKISLFKIVAYLRKAVFQGSKAVEEHNSANMSFVDSYSILLCRVEKNVPRPFN